MSRRVPLLRGLPCALWGDGSNVHDVHYLAFDARFPIAHPAGKRADGSISWDGLCVPGAQSVAQDPVQNLHYPSEKRWRIPADAPEPTRRSSSGLPPQLTSVNLPQTAFSWAVTIRRDGAHTRKCAPAWESSESIGKFLLRPLIFSRLEARHTPRP